MCSILNEGRQRYLKIIKENVSQLNALVDDLWNISSTNQSELLTVLREVLNSAHEIHATNRPTEADVGEIEVEGESCVVDAVKDPRINKAGTWHTRGNYQKEYVMSKGMSLEEAFKNWELKARGEELPEPSPQPAKDEARRRSR